MTDRPVDLGACISAASKSFDGLAIATASHRVSHAVRIGKEIMFQHQVKHFTAADVVAVASLILENEAKARSEHGAGKAST